MDILIRPKKLNGKLNVITSKSFAHRAIVCAALSRGVSVIKNVNFCEDVLATINALRDVVDIQKDGNDLIIKGGIERFSKKKFYVENSGSTIRFLLPLLSYMNQNESSFVVGKTLTNRPLNEYEKIYQEENKKFEKTGNCLIVSNFPNKKTYTLSTEQSSQFVSGILFLSPFLGHEVEINILGDVKSEKYIDETIYVMSLFGINVKKSEKKYLVTNNQIYKPNTFSVPSDLSFLTNCIVMNKLGSNIEFENLLIDSHDPDYDFIEKLNSDKFLNTAIDFENNIDLVPPLSIYSSLVSKEPVVFSGVSRLKFKESNRLQTIANSINKLGGNLTNEETCIVVKPTEGFYGGIIDTHNDHRIALMGLVLSTVTKNDVIIKQFNCVDKSYPDALNDLFGIGLDYEIIKTPTQLTCTLNKTQTNIFIQPNIIKELDKYFDNKTNKKIIITEKNIPSQIIETIKTASSAFFVYVIDKEKEEIKSFDLTKKIIDFLIKNNFSKSDEIIAVGGGCVLDLVGFVSMIYKRGTQYTSIPTTLLSQIDASIGGKVAINENKIKNVVGGFYPPKQIFIDSTTLNTLPEREFRSGVVEMIKIAAISDPTLFYDIYDSPPYEKINKWIEKAVEDKIRFVEKDPYDQNERRALNFGHTYGHAIESISKNAYNHGEAVAKGMFFISQNKKLKECLTKYGLLLDIPYSVEKLNKFVLNDKKIENNRINIVELEEIGFYKIKNKEINNE